MAQPPVNMGPCTMCPDNALILAAVIRPAFQKRILTVPVPAVVMVHILALKVTQEWNSLPNYAIRTSQVNRLSLVHLHWEYALFLHKCLRSSAGGIYAVVKRSHTWLDILSRMWVCYAVQILEINMEIKKFYIFLNIKYKLHRTCFKAMFFK